MNAGLLLLADSRLPAGAHAHSGGLEATVDIGAVTGLADLEGFLRGRLATAGLASAALAAAACAYAAEAATETGWVQLAREAAARTPSPAQRRAACAQGRSLLRAGRMAWPHPVLDSLAASLGPDQLYHPIVLGGCAHAAGGTPPDAALITATAAITGPASAAIRLLGLDPLAVNAMLARLSPDADSVAAAAAAAVATAAADPGAPSAATTAATTGTGEPTTITTTTRARSGRSRQTGHWAALPAPASPGLDLLAERHALQEVALFES